MKKFLTSMIVAAMVLMNGVGTTFGLSYEESYKAARDYYAQKTELISVDEIITYESLGLKSDSLAMKDVIKTDYAGDIAKSVIALVLHGDDPRDYQGVNYVEMLEKCVQENGAFDKEKNEAFANYQVYGVYALYVIHSSKANLASDYLASLIGDDGSFGSSYGPSVDITAWCLEALSLVNKTKYQATIHKALANIQATQAENAGYKDTYMGVNPNTQACVLMGLIGYDHEGLKNGVYNKGTNNPYDVLISYQNSDGSFWSMTPGEDNAYATPQGILAVGYYNNGSIYKKAYQDYQEVLNKKEEVKKDPVVETPKKDIVETSDESSLGLYLTFLVVSSFIVVGRIKFIG